MLNLSENTIRNTNAAAMKAIRMTFGVEQMVVLIFLAMLFLMVSCHIL
jgi:RNA polymerase sigma-70 factor (ECF subfamily)